MAWLTRIQSEDWCMRIGSIGCAGLAAAGGTRNMGRPGSTGACPAIPCERCICPRPHAPEGCVSQRPQLNCAALCLAGSPPSVRSAG